MNEHELNIVARMGALGYELRFSTGSRCFISGHGGGSFRSVFSAADYVVSLTHDDKLRELVSGLGESPKQEK